MPAPSFRRRLLRWMGRAVLLALTASSVVLPPPALSLYQRERAAFAEAKPSAAAARALAEWYANRGDEAAQLPHLAAETERQTSAALWQAQGRIWLGQRRWQDAAQAMRAALALNPQDAWAHYHLGALLLISDPNAAQGHLAAVPPTAVYGDLARQLRGALLDPRPGAGYRGAAILAQARQYALAEAVLRALAGLDHPAPVAMALVGWMMDAQGEDGSAWIAAALAQDAAQAQVWTIAGLHRRAQGDLLGALAAFASAYALDATSPLIQAEIGETYQRLGDNASAEDWLRQAQASAGQTDDEALIALIAAYANDVYPSNAIEIPVSTPEATNEP